MWQLFRYGRKTGWRKLPELSAASFQPDLHFPLIRASTAPNPGKRSLKNKDREKRLDEVKRKLLPCDYKNPKEMFCAPQPKIQRRPRTSVGAERKIIKKQQTISALVGFVRLYKYIPLRLFKFLTKYSPLNMQHPGYDRLNVGLLPRLR